MAREALLDQVPIPPENVHRIRGEDDPAAAALAYERVLRGVLRTPEGPPRSVPGNRIDFILLGVGEEGHTASIFPDSAAAHEKVRWVMAERVAAVPAWRVTLTPPIINTAAEVVFLVSGASKAEILERVIDGPRGPRPLPAQLIEPADGRVLWLADAAAASSLRRTTGH
jgi:6-phosphogluconolactonase